MFKTAARKIAHNSTMPGLAGKQDLRTLQDLITAEKTVLTSCANYISQLQLSYLRVRCRLQRLSTDFGRASDALRVWGQGEGDDLGVRVPSLLPVRCMPTGPLGYAHGFECIAHALHFRSQRVRQP